ncbi:MAG: hypothetical protein GY835_03115, partial [bacterium]|nr:hypothetical protein [bacterium]
MRDKVAEIDATDDSTNEGIKKKNELFLDLKKQDIYVNAHLLPNIWCSAFIWEKWEGWARDGKSRTRLPITDRTLRKPEGHYLHLDRADRDEARRYAGEYQFFHWYNAFPSVFRVPRAEQGEEPDNPHTGWSGGFDVVLVNPPWERIKLQEKEFFSWRSPA